MVNQSFTPLPKLLHFVGNGASPLIMFGCSPLGDSQFSLMLDASYIRFFMQSPRHAQASMRASAFRRQPGQTDPVGYQHHQRRGAFTSKLRWVSLIIFFLIFSCGLCLFALHFLFLSCHKCQVVVPNNVYCLEELPAVGCFWNF